MRLEEATQSITDEAPWYSVVASIDGNDIETAKRIAREKFEITKSMGIDETVEIYKTKISNNYAVVIGGPVTQSQAASLASMSRTDGLADDAFAQKDRSWTLVEKITTD